MLTARGSDNAEIRVAAINVLGTLGDRSVMPVLLAAAVSGEDTLEQAARDSLAELNDKNVDAACPSALAEQ